PRSGCLECRGAAGRCSGCAGATRCCRRSRNSRAASWWSRRARSGSPSAWRVRWCGWLQPENRRGKRGCGRISGCRGGGGGGENHMESRLRAFAHRHRLPAKRLVTGLVRVLPGSAGRRLRALAEQVAFRVRPEYQGDTLPPIFHFWSGRFLHPVLQDHGIGSPESFYLLKILGTQAAGPILRVVSYGAGSCALELDIAEALRDRGVAFEMTCVDFNEAPLHRASAGASSRGLLPAVRVLAAR